MTHYDYYTLQKMYIHKHKQRHNQSHTRIYTHIPYVVILVKLQSLHTIKVSLLITKLAQPQQRSSRRSRTVVWSTELDIYFIQMPYLLFTLYHLMQPPIRAPPSSGLFLATIYNNQSQLAERKHVTLLVDTGCSSKCAPSPLVITTKLAAAILVVAVVRRKGSAGPVLPLWYGQLFMYGN